MKTEATQKENDSPRYEKIEFKEKFSYGLGDAATAIAGVTITSFGMFYFTDIVGVSAALIGTILIFSRVFDAITNILMGYIVDRTSSKYGKARSWVLWTMVPFALFTIILFSVPSSLSSTGSLIYIAIAYNLYFLAYTASNIPYGTLGTLITQDPLQRSQLNIFRMVAYFVSTLLISNITLPLVEFFGGEASSWRTVVIIYSIVMVGMFFLTFYFTKERVTPSGDVETSQKNKMSLGKSIKLLLKNNYWLLLFLIMILAWGILGLFQGVPVYYATYILGNSSFVGPLATFFNLPLIAGFFVTGLIVKKFGRRRIIIAGLIILIASSALMIVDPYSVILANICTLLRGVGFAPIMGTAYAMLADVIDYGEWKNGVRNDGLSYSSGTFSTTVGSAVASSGVGWLLGLSGYISGGSAQPDGVYSMIQFMFIYLPLIISLLLIILMLFYKLDNFHPEIVKDLRMRNGEKSN
ncbi:MFS transporter [Tetragenococcus koreensis]|uniref:Na+/xyloside symporter related transporter n=1 Tax=Tetragenococcus koreensis TaxID=290335 RepID=A0AAN4ZPW9_9ENTE|nr:glycoside-pentoside-hexuronide (GPH):cation symporter [Tetragenococcus koreensis]GEQ50139.1 Na+/xyloside symporter related transporter [Tetragenococcus koreensis]GEQ52610.1 Na+/xyloside symporter related transporter [Tetragenococcus koreensis]GEQ55145.1 Na+/xyloside symporter related transporter [Tetragenococcus koreensis]GEQ57611.1 Na+/xyloside symporter related transporter [Tetragenococcus koreensis]GEQ60153.1 Na+/xyloside symporter related transporter [Tetragenococcus koreensis]